MPENGRIRTLRVNRFEADTKMCPSMCGDPLGDNSCLLSRHYNVGKGVVLFWWAAIELTLNLAQI